MAPCEKVVNNRTEFTIEEHDFRYLYGMNVAGSVKAGWWDTISVEEACRMGIHKSAIDQKSRGEIVEGDWNIGFIWLSVGEAGEDRGYHYATQTGAEGKWKIELYNFQSSSTSAKETEVTDPEARDEDGLFWLGGHDRIGSIAEIDLLCFDYPGRRLVMEHGRRKYPSARAQKYMDRSKMKLHRDADNHCLRGYFLNALELFSPSRTHYHLL